MNDNNISPLNDIEYTAAPKKTGPEGVAAPILDDIDYSAPSSKKGGPTGVSAPVLDDMDTYTPHSKKGAPEGVSAPVLDNADALYTSAPKKKIMTDEEIIDGLTPDLKEKFDILPPDKQKQIVDMRRSQLGAEAPAAPVSAPVLDDDNYVPPHKEEKKAQPEQAVTAPILDDEPAPARYVPKFVDEDLERAKREGAKKAVSSQLTSDQKDSKESLRMMLELKEERQAEMASKGFKISILLAVIGIAAAVLFYLLYSGQMGLSYKDGLGGFSNTIKNSSLYIAAAVGVCSLTLITGISGFKSLTSFVYLLFGIVQIFPGLPMIPQHEGSIGKAVAFYAAAMICTLAVFITLNASECVGLFFKKQKKNYD